MTNARPAALRKAAVLIASLDRESAERMLDGMPGYDAALVRDLVEEMGPIDPLEQRQVIEEFFRISPLMPEQSPPGIELAGSLAEQLSMPDRVPNDMARECERQFESSAVSSDTLRPFHRLQHADCESLVELLRHEQPQTAAVILSHLPAQRAAELLAELPTRLQSDVARRLASLDETDPEVLAEIERAIEDWLERHQVSTHRRGVGMSALRGILEAADFHTQQNLLTGLSTRERRQARQRSAPSSWQAGISLSHVESKSTTSSRPIARQPVQVRRPSYRFTDLMSFDDHALSTTLHRADAEVLILALAGVDPEWLARIERLLPVEAARMLRYGLGHLGPIRLSDVEVAQQQLAQLATQLEESGELSLASRRSLSLAV